MIHIADYRPTGSAMERADGFSLLLFAAVAAIMVFILFVGHIL
jgi:hypothetical protein